MNKKLLDIDGWEVSQPKTLLITNVTTVESGQVICQRTGKESEFYRFVFPDWVNVIAVTEENKIVVVKQFRYGTQRMETEIPGGVIHAKEPPLDAGCRELLEETGYVGQNPRIVGMVKPNPALQGNSCYTLLIEKAKKVSHQNLDEMEDIETELLSVQEVFSAVDRGEIQHGLVINALMFCRPYLIEVKP